MKYNNRPKLKAQYTKADVALEIFGWLLLITVWVLTLLNYNALPDTIPTHFNSEGIADGFGSKWNSLTLPIVASVLFIGMTVLNKYPNLFNYPDEITAENALKNYTIAARLIRVLKLVIVIIFGSLAYKTIETANGHTDGLSIWFLPLTLGLIFIPIIYFLIKMTKTS